MLSRRPCKRLPAVAHDLGEHERPGQGHLPKVLKSGSRPVRINGPRAPVQSIGVDGSDTLQRGKVSALRKSRS